MASLLATSDRAAGGLARIATTLGQAALVCLGVHLAADQLDDRVFAGLTGLQGLADSHLAGSLGALAEALGQPTERFLFWDGLPLAAASAWAALAVELLAIALLCASFLLTSRQPQLSWARWRGAFSVQAVVLPLTLAGTLLAGAWSLSMATEDLLPSSPVAPWAAGVLALAAFLRFGWPAWARAVSSLERSGRLRLELLGALVLAPVGLLAWMHGLPIWGWLP